MGLFKKKSDPLQDELRRLQEEQSRVEEQLAELEDAIQNPPLPITKPAEEPRTNRQRGAVFLHDPLLEKNPTPRSNQARLKVQHHKARTRVLLLCLVLLILGFIVYRAWR